MRLPGWCRVCHRFRRVRPETLPGTPSGLVAGVCDECDEKRSFRRFLGFLVLVLATLLAAGYHW